MAKAWMPFYVADYLADTGHLDHEEHGVYVLAIMHYWQTGKPLQANAKQLQSICRCFASEKFEQIWSNVSAFFVLTDEGWRHERIEQELSKARQLSEKRKESGRKGGKNTQANAQAIATPIATPKAEQLPTQSQSQSQSQEQIQESLLSPDEPADPRERIPYEDIRLAYNKFCPSFAKATELNDARKNNIRLRWAKYKNHFNGPLIVFDTLFKKAEASDFLTGRDGRWAGKRGIDWLLNAANMVKVLEGNYDNVKNVSQAQHREDRILAATSSWAEKMRAKQNEQP